MKGRITLNYSYEPMVEGTIVEVFAPGEYLNGNGGYANAVNPSLKGFRIRVNDAEFLLLERCSKLNQDIQAGTLVIIRERIANKVMDLPDGSKVLVNTSGSSIMCIT